MIDCGYSKYFHFILRHFHSDPLLKSLNISELVVTRLQKHLKILTRQSLNKCISYLFHHIHTRPSIENISHLSHAL